MAAPRPSFKMHPPREPSGLMESLGDFVAAVDWNEQWIWAVAGMHLVLVGIAVLTRGNTTVQSALLFGLLILARLSETLNAWAGAHWASFAGQNYFDPRGGFVGLLYAAPLLLLSFGIVCNLLVKAARLLITVKRAQLRKQAADNSQAPQAKGKLTPSNGHRKQD